MNVIDHVHSTAECDGIAVITLRRRNGETYQISIGASRCPMNPDTIESVTEHWQKFTTDAILDVQLVGLLDDVKECE
jgi:hypothetical protein